MKFLIEIKDELSLEQAINGEKPAVLVFSATWCPDCLFMETYIKDVVAAFPQFNFYSINTSETNFAEKYNVVGIPSLVVFEKGEEKNRLVSRLRKTKKEVLEFLGGIN